MMPGIPELIVILAILMLLFGAKKLPELARSLGTSAKEIRKGFRDDTDEKKRVKRSRKSPRLDLVTGQDETTTLGQHLAELQNRLFAVAVCFLLFSVLAYPFFDKIVSFLISPLGQDHKLVYLTPGGAFGIIIQACMYIGFVVVLPLIIYNLYRFIMPIVNQVTMRRAIGFTIASFVLAVAGMAFAYYISLPAALYFLTGFELYHIDPMLTIDSYFGFIMMYMLVGAVLFQIPLIMLLINSIRPLGPRQLMSYQDKIISGSFIIAAIISPTPDVINQTLLASPMIVMYQAGVILVWLKNRNKSTTVKRNRQSLDDIVIPIPPAKDILAIQPKAISQTRSVDKSVRRSVDGFSA